MIPRKRPLYSHRNFGIPTRMEDVKFRAARLVVVALSGAGFVILMVVFAHVG